MKILIVDDHAVIHQGLRRILGDEFADSTFGEARHTQQALQLLNERWDLVILDIDLPGRSGLDLLPQLRSEHPKLPVVVFSMHAEEQYAVRALKVGASAYVAKDSPSLQLLDAVRKVIRGGRYVSAELAERLAEDLGREKPQKPHELLSTREFEVMRMIAAGKTTTNIADILALSVKTISTYRTRILQKLHLGTNAELIRYVIDHQLDHL
jgi:DNA-binding NarL/FixJ family response regulator